MNNNSNNIDHIKLEIKDQKLIDRGIVQSFELDKETNTIILEINTIYDKTTIPVTFLRNKMTWQSFLRDLDTSLIETAGIDDKNDRKLIKRTVSYYHNEISSISFTTDTTVGDGGGGVSENKTKGNVDDDTSTTAAEEKQPSKILEKILIDLALENVTLFKDESGTPHAIVKIKDHYDVLSIEGSRFKRYLFKLFYDTFDNSIVNAETINNVVQILQTNAEYEGRTIPLHLRAAWSNTETKDTIYYDLTDETRRCVRITKDGWKISENQLEVLFKRYRHQLPQIEPFRLDTMDGIDGIILDKLVDLFNVKDSDNKLLLKCYIISLFIPEIAKPVLMLHGEQGSAKSMLQELVKMLVDPSYLKTLSFPRDSNEFIQQLSHNYIVYYDNISEIREWISDLLCRAVTGGGSSKRQLYTDDEDIIYNFKRIVGLNGINLGATKADLLDRGLIIQLERIPKQKNRKPEDIHKDLIKLKPQLLGYIFDILVKVLKLKEQLGGKPLLSEYDRMAEFEEYAKIISRCMGNPEGEFLRAYQDNIGVQIDEAIAASPLSMAIVELMKDSYDDKGNVLKVKEDWDDTPTKLSEQLNEIAETTLKINIQRSKSWPKSASYLSRRLNEVKTNLIEKGIEIEKYKDKKGNRKIKICKVSSMPSSRQESDELSTKQSEKIDGTENNDQVSSNVPSKENSEIQAQKSTLDAMDAMDGTLQTKEKEGPKVYGWNSVPNPETYGTTPNTLEEEEE